MTRPTIITPGLTFDAATHTYRYGGRVIPGVTSIIAAAGLYTGTEFWTEEARTIGTWTHDAIHAYDEDDLIEEDLDWRVSTRLEAYKSLMRDLEAETLASEIALAHPVLHYAGIVDRLAFVEGGVNGGVWGLDWKAGGFQAAYLVQLAAYAELVRVNAGDVGLTSADLPGEWRVAELRTEGTYKLFGPGHPRLTMREAHAIFLSALNIHRFKEQYHGNVANPVA